MSSCRYSCDAALILGGGPVAVAQQSLANGRLSYCSLEQISRSVEGSMLRQRNGRRSTPRSTYKHIPHREKAPHLVQRRNARERRRVQAVNNAFSRLRRHVPYDNKHKRLSKVKTLRIAIDYIKQLQRMIRDYDTTPHNVNGGGQTTLDMMELNTSKENKMHWIPLNLSSGQDQGSTELYMMDTYSHFQQS